MQVEIMQKILCGPCVHSWTACSNHHWVGANPGRSLGSGDPFHSVSYSKVSASINYFTGAVYLRIK